MKFNIDARPSNAAWLKPTERLNLDARPTNAAWLKHTPDRLADLATVAAAPPPAVELRADYNPAQPRDGRGRFGSGGGGAGGGSAGAATAETVDEAVEAWGGSSTGCREIRDSIAAGQPTPDAQVLLDELGAAPASAPELYRGIALDQGGAQDLWKPGQETDFNLSSFSADQKRASVFADVGSSPDPKAEGIYFTLKPGAQALDLAPHTSPGSFRAGEQEWITGGRFRVDSINEIPDPWESGVRSFAVNLTQTAVMQ